MCADGVSESSHLYSRVTLDTAVLSRRVGPNYLVRCSLNWASPGRSFCRTRSSRQTVHSVYVRGGGGGGRQENRRAETSDSEAQLTWGTITPLPLSSCAAAPGVSLQVPVNHADTYVSGAASRGGCAHLFCVKMQWKSRINEHSAGQVRLKQHWPSLFSLF